MSEWYDCDVPDQRSAGVLAARDAVRRGELVVLPTDTVYGVGANAFSPPAVNALLMSKGRGRDMPVPVLVGSPGTIDGFAFDIPHRVRELADVFWPGGLTIIMRHVSSLAWDLGDSRGTVAVRMPMHPVALELLGATGPMAVSSANRTGQPPATTAAAAREQLGDDVAVYLESGPCGDPLPSTIVDLTGPKPVLRRVGAVSEERLREVVPDLVLPDPSAVAAPEEPADAAGQAAEESGGAPDGAAPQRPGGPQPL